MIEEKIKKQQAEEDDNWEGKVLLCMNNYEVENKFEYKVKYLCISDDCKTNAEDEKMIVVLDMNGDKTVVERIRFKIPGSYP
jgi:hypothetical protein